MFYIIIRMVEQPHFPTTLPNHPGRDLTRPLIREILREIELTPEQFLRELDEI